MGRQLKAIIVALCIIAPIPALAGRNDAEWNPPARYDHPYDGWLIERKMPQRQVVAACRALFKDYGAKIVATDTQRGCSVRRRGKCIIYYVDAPYKKATPEAVRRHEIGHCNGWPADHPHD